MTMADKIQSKLRERYGCCETKVLEYILALFTEQQVEALDVAFDKGFDTGKMEGQIEAKQQQAPLVEALKEVMVQAGEYIPLGLKAKIDSAMKEMGK